ncbi:Acg family FMN-binding oxidoreductase [Variovorax sp. LT2P21]
MTPPLLLNGCSLGAGDRSYTEAVQRTWRPDAPVATGRVPLLEELVRCATLAPSSHNTQCWKFALQEQSVDVIPDLSRRCPAVDPDDHHLFVSLGCATENLVQAALAHGLKAEAVVDASAGSAVRVRLEPTRAVASELFDAIFERQCTRAEFDGQPVSTAELKLLERAGTGSGVRLLILDDRAAMEKTLAHVVAANTVQMDDPAFVEELKHWIRFGDAEAVRTGDGLFTGASGNPSVPRWLGERLFSGFFTAKTENDKYAKQVRSSAGIAVFASAGNDKAHWVEVGRCYQRFALQATALGIRNAFLNQPVEVASMRPQLARDLGLGAERPDLVVRFGRGREMPRSLRRPVAAVLTSE